MEQESIEMINLQKKIRSVIDEWKEELISNIYIACNENFSNDTKESFGLLKKSLSTQDQKKAFEKTMKFISIAVLGSFFNLIDEGIEMPNDEYLLLDIVNRETKESIISYSAYEEFYFLMPDGYEPFEENK